MNLNKLLLLHGFRPKIVERDPVAQEAVFEQLIPNDI